MYFVASSDLFLFFRLSSLKTLRKEMVFIDFDKILLKYILLRSQNLISFIRTFFLSFLVYLCDREKIVEKVGLVV